MKEEFLNHVKNHQMIIKNDSGVHRHLLFKQPNTIDRYFNITTWDGHLCISGDMGTYVFRRLTDMFYFFRGEGINLGYWSEKLEAGKCKEYSPEKARAALDQEFENWLDYRGKDASKGFIENEKSELDNIDTDDYHEFVEAVRNWCPNKGGVQLDDFWEHDLYEYTYHFTWCCHAIVWAIEQYDKHKEKLMTPKKKALLVNKNLKAKKVGMKWQVFDGDKPYAIDQHSPQNAWYEAQRIALCPFKVGDTLRRISDGKTFTVVAHSVIGCVNHLIDENGVTDGLYEWKYSEYEVVK